MVHVSEDDAYSAESDAAGGRIGSAREVTILFFFSFLLFPFLFFLFFGFSL